jgi:hypothetical protein
VLDEIGVFPAMGGKTSSNRQNCSVYCENRHLYSNTQVKNCKMDLPAILLDRWLAE